MEFGQESVITVQQRGHASALETLDTNAGLWPGHDPALRDTLDQLLSRPTKL
jgi:hypothetical protein